MVTEILCPSCNKSFLTNLDSTIKNTKCPYCEHEQNRSELKKQYMEQEKHESKEDRV